MVCAAGRQHLSTTNRYQENAMPKGQQRTNKETKKQRKDTAPPKPVSPDAVRPTITTVVPVRGKVKK
jgi:hypothetical protein